MDNFNTFLKSMESWKENVAKQLATIHSSPSDLTLEKFKNIDGRFNSIDSKLADILAKLNSTESRVRAIEDWKLVFTAKFSIYSAIAIFFGSIIGQSLFWFISTKFTA